MVSLVSDGFSTADRALAGDQTHTHQPRLLCRAAPTPSILRLVWQLCLWAPGLVSPPEWTLVCLGLVTLVWVAKPAALWCLETTRVKCSMDEGSERFGTSERSDNSNGTPSNPSIRPRRLCLGLKLRHKAIHVAEQEPTTSRLHLHP